jgi:hypothetical protein
MSHLLVVVSCVMSYQAFITLLIAICVQPLLVIFIHVHSLIAINRSISLMKCGSYLISCHVLMRSEVVEVLG